MSCYDNEERITMTNKIAFNEDQLRRVLLRLGIKMQVQDNQVLLESTTSDNGWYLDMLRVV
jgi:hypothetical protein